MATKEQLETRNRNLKEKLNKARYKVEELEIELKDLKQKTKYLSEENTLLKKGPAGKNCVYLDGKEYKIQQREMAKDLVELIKKRFIKEDDTCLSLNRTGS